MAASTVDGRVLRRATAWGKHLFHHYDGGAMVHVHLGLYGTFREWARPPDDAMPAPVGQVRMRIVGADGMIPTCMGKGVMWLCRDKPVQRAGMKTPPPRDEGLHRFKPWR